MRFLLSRHFSIGLALSLSGALCAQVSVEPPPAQASSEPIALSAPAASSTPPPPSLPTTTTPSVDDLMDFPPDFPADLRAFFQELLNEPMPEGMGNGSNSFNSGDMGALPQDGEGSVGQIVFADESPFQVFALLQSLTGKPILIQQSLPNVKINFSSSGPMKREEAVAAIEGVLALNGIAITPVGANFMRAVPAANAAAQAPAFLNGSSKDFAPSNQIYSKFFTLEYLSPADAGELVKPFMSPGIGVISQLDKQHMLLLTDTLVNLQHIETILDKVDHPASTRDKIFFFNLKNATASDLQQRLSQMQERGLKNRFQGPVILEADDRTNQLLVITHAANLTELESIIRGLDADSTSFTYSEAYQLRHAESTKVAELINEIVGGQKKARAEKQRKQDTPLQEIERKVAEGKNQSKDPNANLEFSDYITVVADERSNAIIAYGTRSDLVQIKSMVEQIDVLLPQVRIEVIISEVTLTDQSKRGIDAFDLSADYSPLSTPKNSDISVRGPTLDTLTGAGVGGAYTLAANFWKNPFSLNLVFNRAQSNANIRILSAPTIVTTHNKEAMIEVIRETPVLTQTITNTGSNTGSNNNTLSNAVNNSVEYKPIGIILKVKPLIGPNGIIQLEIDQEISTSNETVDLNTFPMPVIAKRQARSFVSAVDQEVIVLGGLRQNEYSDDKGKLFILGDIPLLGPLLFSPRIKRNVTRELVIFIKPYIVGMPDAASKPIQSYNEQVDRIVDLSANREEIITFISEGHFPDIPPTDMCRPLSTILPDPEYCTPRTPTAEIPRDMEMAPPPAVPGPVRINNG